MAMLMTFTGRASAEDLAPAPPDRVWYRCCYNLISLYHNTRALPTLRSVLDLALALSPLDAPGTYNKISADLRMLRAQVIMSTVSAEFLPRLESCPILFSLLVGIFIQ